MQFIDRPFSDDVLIVDPRTALMAGYMKTNDIPDLEMFEAAFPANPSVIMQVATSQREKGEAAGTIVETPDDVTPEQKSDLMFLEMLPLCFNPEVAGDWETVMHWQIEGAANYTIKVENGACEISKGLIGEADCLVETTYEHFRTVVRHRALQDSTLVTDEQLEEWDNDDVSLDVELSDDQLEAIAGGKGSSACGAAACGTDVGAGTACGAAACGGALGVGTACGADACTAAACAGAACGAAAGHYSACAAAGCGAAVGGPGACAGDACGVAAGAGVCAGNACGIDILGGADIGPCGINIIPGIPFC